MIHFKENNSNHFLLEGMNVYTLSIFCNHICHNITSYEYIQFYCFQCFFRKNKGKRVPYEKGNFASVFTAAAADPMTITKCPVILGEDISGYMTNKHTSI